MSFTLLLFKRKTNNIEIHSFVSVASLGIKSVAWVSPNTQLGVFLAVRCLRACLDRWSLRMKLLWHKWQINFFSPVCVRRWRDSSSERANRLSQPSHLHLKGFSPDIKKNIKCFYSPSKDQICPHSIHLRHSLTCVGPHMGLEVRTFEVGLSAVFVRTHMTTYTRQLSLDSAVFLFHWGGARCRRNSW